VPSANLAMPTPRFGPVVANAGWNLLGNLLPALAGLLAVPYLLHRLGNERFGLLSLGWVLIGYFGLFDFGLGRALTKGVADRWNGSRDAEIDSLCSTGLALGALAGIGGGLLLVALAAVGEPWLADRVPGLLHEATLGLALIGLGVLPTVLTAVLGGMLEGLQRFRAVTAVRAPAGVLLFAAPCVSAWATPRLEWALAALVATRWLTMLAFLMLCRSTLRFDATLVSRRWVASLLGFGGWLTVSNVVGPVIVYLDRFIVGFLLSPARLAYYVAPFDVVSRLLVVPMSLTRALFPALAQAQQRDPDAARALRRRSFQLTGALVVPLAVLGGLASDPLLRWWLGGDFAQHSSGPMQLLLVGFAFNALAQIPMVALQGHGQARQAALLHLVELPIYAACLYGLVVAYGLVGAALAWALRGAIDALALATLLRRVERR